MTSFCCASLSSLVRGCLLLAFTVQVWLFDAPVASAQLLAQTGAIKTGLGWGLVGLALLLGLIVVCRPAGRNKVVRKRLERIQK